MLRIIACRTLTSTFGSFAKKKSLRIKKNRIEGKMGFFKNTLFWKAVLVALAAPRLHAQNATDNATGNATGNTTGNATVTPALPLCSELQAAADAAAGNSTGNATAECVIIASLGRRVSVGGGGFFSSVTSSSSFRGSLLLTMV
jgi:hypothetical protein